MRRIRWKTLLALALCGAPLAGCQPEIIDVSFQGYSITLRGPDEVLVPSDRDGHPYFATDRYELRVAYFEDAEAKRPYGSSIPAGELPEIFQGFESTAVYRIAGQKTSFTLGDGKSLAFPLLSEDQKNLFVRAEVVGFDANGKMIARARCPLLELRRIEDDSTPKVVECRPFYGFIGRWNPIASPKVARVQFGAAALPDGRVVIGGGRRVRIGDDHFPPVDSVEVFDPYAPAIDSLGNETGGLGRWDTLPVGLRSARYDLTATATERGHVLFVGGRPASTIDGYSRAIDVFDPIASAMTQPPFELTVQRAEHGAALLSGENVLVLGGNSSPTSSPDSAERVTPDSVPVFINSAFDAPRRHPCVVQVKRNLALVCGGGKATCETFDGVAFRDAGDLGVARSDVKCASVDGQVVIVGGATEGSLMSRRILVWKDVGVGQLSESGQTPFALNRHAVAAGNGKVVVAGGAIFQPGADPSSPPVFTSAVTVIDPATSSYRDFMHFGDGALDVPSADHQLVSLPDGNVMIVGGRDAANTVIPQAAIFVVPDSLSTL